MRTLASLLAAGLLLGSAAPARAALRVTGIVQDDAGRPIPVAIVTVRGDGRSVQAPSDIEGRFAFNWDGPDEVAVSVDAKGYAERRQTVRLGEAGGGLTLVLTRLAFGEEVTVTGGRRQGLGETPASIYVLSSEDLAATAAPVLDDALRFVPGFTLFRRTGSRIANPTAQGVTLRGLGGSGTSRALVLDDGIPMNDPFGGWVYWGRVPRGSLERVEVMRGGGSHRYGSGALAGVIQLVRRTGAEQRLDVDAAGGTQGTFQGAINAQAGQGPWTIRVAADGFTHDGYILVDDDVRGPVDTPSSAQFLTEEVTVEYGWKGGTRVFARGNIYSEDRHNGTQLQTNQSEVKSGALGFDWPRGAGALSVRAYLTDQLFEQTFSTVAPGRRTETPSRDQRVPSDAAGFLATWTQAFGSRTLSLGVDRGHVSGQTEETVFTPDGAVETIAEGTQRTWGVFGDHAWGLGGRGSLTVGARFDEWKNVDARRVVGTEVTELPGRRSRSISPRAALLFRLAPSFSVTSSAYRAFRAPTLNELYRTFQVGDVVTLANDQLVAESVEGIEAGFLAGGGSLSLRATVFRMHLSDTVANVTLQAQPGLITRQRQNLGSVRSQGVEVDAEARVGGVVFSVGWLRADAEVRSFSADPTLVGKQVPQSPLNQASAALRYIGSTGRTIGIQGRWAGSQFDDDRNAFPLGTMRTMDVFVALPLARVLDIFAAGENVLGGRYEVGRTPVVTLGPPRAVRFGVRLRLAPGRAVSPD
jgi:outer membrane receptor protein involved in Fe transport